MKNLVKNLIGMFLLYHFTVFRMSVNFFSVFSLPLTLSAIQSENYEIRSFLQYKRA